MADRGSEWGSERGPEVDVLGVCVCAIDLPKAVDRIAGWIDRSEKQYVCVTGVHGVMECQGDPELMRIHNESGLTTCDGMPLVWASKSAGVADAGRVYGPDLMLDVCEASIEHGWTHYFYGGAEGVPEQLAESLGAKFPGLKVVGTYSPPFRELTDEESSEIVERINYSGADLVWVGLSTPKQERWMAAHRDQLEAAALLGVGAAFDFHTGRVRQAPAWIQQSGFEWAFRMAMEPQRLAKRYLSNNPRFVLGVMRQRPRLVAESSTRD